MSESPQISIFYSLIAKESKIILADYSESYGNFQVAAISLIKKIKKNTLCKINYPPYEVYYEDVNDLTFMVFSQHMNTESAFSFLYDIKHKFLNMYDKNLIKEAFAYTFKDFSSEIRVITKFYKDNSYYKRQDILKDHFGNNIKVEENNITDLAKPEEIIDLSNSGFKQGDNIISNLLELSNKNDNEFLELANKDKTGGSDLLVLKAKIDRKNRKKNTIRYVVIFLLILLILFLIYLYSKN